MAAASDRDEQIAAPSELHGMDDVRHPRATGDQTGMLIDARIPDLPRFVVAGILRQDDLPLEILGEGVDERLVDGSAVAPLQPGSFHLRPRRGVAPWRKEPGRPALPLHCGIAESCYGCKLPGSGLAAPGNTG